MGLMKRDLICVVIGFLVAGCTGLTFGYKYYGMDLAKYEGSLLGPKPADDIPFDRCTPTQSDPHPCVVMFRPEFFRLKADFLDTKQKLIDCQRGLVD